MDVARSVAIFNLSVCPMEANIARILLKPKDENTRPPDLVLPMFQFDPCVMVDMFPGPALLIDADMTVIHQNIFAKSLMPPLEKREAFLETMITRCLSNNCPDTQKATLKEPTGLRHYDLYAFPVKAVQKNTVPMAFLFGRETTIEHNLTNALVDSRQMFKDLVNCSTDFAWETDSNGKFIYVSPKGILGYTAFELNGKPSGDLIIGDNDNNPFSTTRKVEEMELWLKRADGAMACLLISAVPRQDQEANWQGARGVCRDITLRREREALLRRTHRQEHVLSKIVSTIRDMTTPTDMLAKATTATLDGIPSDSCLIIQKTNHPGGDFTAEVKQQGGLPLEADFIYKLCQKAMACWTPSETADYSENIATEAMLIGTRLILMGITSHHGKNNGAIFLIRDKDNHWQEDEVHLFNGITTHLGIALEQVITHEELERRAFTDELTTLLTRRAFTKEITKRLKNQTRSRRDGAMLYLDLDNFKNVNDSKGHAHGDMILKQLAKIIRDNIRVGDYAARLGGDEFAIWLDEISAKDTLAIAHNFVASGARLCHLADVEGPPLSISLGIAISHPEDDQTFDQLMDNADKALYQAKSAGKATYALYDPATENTRQKGENDA
ncbi:MAG: diguanylate cyclase [Emcibacter sp.]|nr:diguanylate cyclase [Emcibacter sp.]